MDGFSELDLFCDEAGERVADDSESIASSASAEFSSPLPHALQRRINPIEFFNAAAAGFGFVGEEFERKCVRHDIAKLYGQLYKGRYVCHTVYWLEYGNNDLSRATKIVDSALQELALYKPTSSCDSWIVAKHVYGESFGNHIHVVHTCRSREKHTDCRCGSIAKWRPMGLRYKRRYRYLYDEKSGANIVLYLSKGKLNGV